MADKASLISPRFERVTDVEVCGPQQLRLTFPDLPPVRVDLTALIARDTTLSHLESEDVFVTARLDTLGLIFTSPNPAEPDNPWETILSYYDLWDMAEGVLPFTGQDLRDWMGRHALNHMQAASYLDCSEGEIVHLCAKAALPFSIKAMCLYLDDHPAILHGLVPAHPPTEL